jgi:hypothetical protein
MFVDSWIQDTPCLLVYFASRQDEIAAQTVTEFLHDRLFQRHFRAIPGDRLDIRCDFSGTAQDGGEPMVDRNCRSHCGCKAGLNESASVHAASPILIFSYVSRITRFSTIEKSWFEIISPN